METWQASGLDIPVSVNISAQQLQDADFATRLNGLLAAHPSVNPSCLEIEVLESSALTDMSLVSQVIHNCGKLGVSFALDDFGTGYSSLAFLKRLPVDVLKIDQTFVRDMIDDPEDLTIVEGMLGLASAFRRQAIAEGVETVERVSSSCASVVRLPRVMASRAPCPPQTFPPGLPRGLPIRNGPM